MNKPYFNSENRFRIWALQNKVTVRNHSVRFLKSGFKMCSANETEIKISIMVWIVLVNYPKRKRVKFIF